MSKPKPPKPWILTEEETFSSFRNWRRTILSNLKPDKNYAPFLKDKATWQVLKSADPNRGLTDDAGENAATKEDKVSYLNDMLNYIAQYSPEVLHSEISINCTTLDEIWQVIRDYYGFKQSETQFLKFSSLKWEQGERPEKLYRRILAHLQDNLLTKESGLLHDKKAPTENEDMSPTVERLAVIKWMELIDPDLHTLVARTFAHDLQTKTLKDLQPLIRDSLDSLLEELKQKREDVHISKLKFQQISSIDEGDDIPIARAKFDHTRPFQSKAFGKSFPRPPSSRQGASSFQPKRECPLCKAAGRRYQGHTYLQCDYVCKADKRQLIRTCKATPDDQCDAEFDHVTQQFHECDIDETF